VLHRAIVGRRRVLSASPPLGYTPVRRSCGGRVVEKLAPLQLGLVRENGRYAVGDEKGSEVKEHDPRFDQLDAEIALEAERDPLAERVCQDVTRVVVVKGVVYQEFWADSWQASVQDGARTLRLFARGDGSEAIAARNVSLGEVLGIPPDSAAEFAQAVATAEGQPDRFGSGPEPGPAQ